MKKTLAIALALILLLAFTACGEGLPEPDNDTASGEDSYEDNATQYTEATTYYNEYLGVAYTVPAGWWNYDLETENFSTAKGTTDTAKKLDIYNGDDYTYMFLADLGNLQFSSKDNHIGITLSAEKANEANTFAEYMEYYEAYMLEPYEENTYELVVSTQVIIKGQTFEKRVYQVDREFPYNIMTLTCELTDGYAFTFYTTYWPENESAEDDIMEAINDSFEFLN